MRIRYGLGVLVLVGGTAVAQAQTAHEGHGAGMDHVAHGQIDPVLNEPGQGAFAALSEVVRVLEADPETDWARVDLAGLRAHLVDMDHLVTGTQVTEEVLPNGLRAVATGDVETIAALTRMVPAHAAQLATDERWSVLAEAGTDGVVLRVTSDDPVVVARIQGLGFFGLMASQDHHRAHHLGIARGEAVHSD